MNASVKKEEVQPLPPVLKSMTQITMAPVVGALLGTTVPLLGPLVGTLMMVSGLTKPAKVLEQKLTNAKQNVVSKERIDEIFQSINLRNANNERVSVSLVEESENYCDVYLQCPLGISKEKVEKDIGILSTYFRNRCFILNPREEAENKHAYDKRKDGLGIVHVRIYTSHLPSMIPFRQVSLTRKQREDSLIFCYGKSHDGWEFVDLSEGHCLIAGETASGKSVLLHVILMQIMLNYSCEEVEIEICDFKEGVEFGCYEGCQHVTSYSSDYSSDVVKDYLQGLFDEMKERNDLFKTIPGCTKLSEYNRKCEPNKRIPRKVVVIEEMVSIMDNKEVKEMFGKLSALARNAGIHLIGTTQRPSKDVISSLLKCNMATRFGLLTADANNSRIIIDTEGCEQLKGKGNGILKNGSLLTEFQAMYLQNDEIHQLLSYMKKSSRFTKRNWRTGELELVEGRKLDELLGSPELEETIVDAQPKKHISDFILGGSQNGTSK